MFNLTTHTLTITHTLTHTHTHTLTNTHTHTYFIYSYLVNDITKGNPLPPLHALNVALMCGFFPILCIHSDREVQVLDYQTQQFKVLPCLATAYAFWFSGRFMQTFFNAVSREMDEGAMEQLPQVTAFL